MTKIALGIDIGGTNTAVGVVDVKGNLLHRFSIPTAKSAEALVAEVKLTYEAIGLKNVSLAGIGIGAPNGNYYKGTVEFAPNLSWKGVVPLAEMFAKHFGVPAWLTNDANAAAIGEMQFGAAKGIKDFIMITLGTGLGSGVVVNGEVVYGHDGFAGELGHIVYDYDGRSCGCGRKGCLETYASATGIVRTAEEWLMKESVSSSLRTSGIITAKSIAEAAGAGDELAIEIFDFTAKVLGRQLADAVAFTSPETIFLFGGLANAGELLMRPLKKHFEESLLQIFKGKIKLAFSALPEGDAAVLGAASLAWHELN